MTDYRVTSLNSSGVHRVYPLDINDHGLIVGYVQDQRQSGFLDDTKTGVITSLDPNIQTSTFPLGLNDEGQVVGYYKDLTGVHGFLLDTATGEKTTIDPAGSTSTILRVINGSGLVLGDYLDKHQTNHSFVEDTLTGAVTQIAIPDAAQTTAAGMNESGAVVGVFNDMSGHAHGFLDNVATGTIQTIDAPGATDTYLSAINDKGQVVGTDLDSGGRHWFVDDTRTGTFKELEVAGVINLSANSINNAGLVVGIYDPVSSGTRSFTYDLNTDVFTPLNISDSSETRAGVVNNQGQIIGTFEDSSGLHGFVADPIPDPPCYCPGTLILTPDGERPVEEIAIGDLLVTASGRHRPVKWVGRRSYETRQTRSDPDILPICVRAGALDIDVPRRDLWVSPGHALFVDGALIHAALLVNGKSIVQPRATGPLTYLHLELDDHDIIIAEGAEAESFLDNGCRKHFGNGEDYHRLYPTAAESLPCFPLLEDGFHLHAIRRRIDARAGVEIDATRKPGSLRGFIDSIGPDGIRGWAQDQSQPEEPVCLDIVVDGARILRLLANRRRGDLRKAGLGSGRHAFQAQLPEGVQGRVEVRRSMDMALLALTAKAQRALHPIPASRSTAKRACLIS